MRTNIWRKIWVLGVALLIGLGGVSLVGCEREPDNGVHIEGDNGLDIDVDAPGDN